MSVALIEECNTIEEIWLLLYKEIRSCADYDLVKK